MNPLLSLTGFLEPFHGEQGLALEPFHGEQGLVLQIQWKDVRCPHVENIGPVPVMEDVSLYSSLQRIPYNSLSRSPPCELDISRSFAAAEFSTECSFYLAPKIASFVSDLASSFGGMSPPSLFVLAEVITLNMDSGPALTQPTEPLIPRRQDPFRLPRSSPLRSRWFHHDDLISDSMEVRGTEVRYSLEGIPWSASEMSVQAISKLKKANLDKEAGDCSVCLEEMLAIEELLSTPCNHIFHEHCIISWLEKKNSCPLCRSQI